MTGCKIQAARDLFTQRDAPRDVSTRLGRIGLNAVSLVSGGLFGGPLPSPDGFRPSDGD
jgi:hypothetical protein